MDEIRVAFGMAVRLERERRHWRQRDLSEQSGVNRGYLSLIERGIASPGLEVQERIARAFGITTERLHQRAREERERRP